MKKLQYLFILVCAGIVSCSKVIDVDPLSNINTATYYSNVDEVKTALIGCYNGMQKPLLNEHKPKQRQRPGTLRIGRSLVS